MSIVTTLRTHSETINGTVFHFSALLVMERGREDGKFQIVAETPCAPFCHVVYESAGEPVWCVNQVESMRGDYLARTEHHAKWLGYVRGYAA